MGTPCRIMRPNKNLCQKKLCCPNHGWCFLIPKIFIFRCALCKEVILSVYYEVKWQLVYCYYSILGKGFFYLLLKYLLNCFASKHFTDHALIPLRKSYSSYIFGYSFCVTQANLHISFLWSFAFTIYWTTFELLPLCNACLRNIFE